MTFPRFRTPERMDDPGLPEADHLQALKGLSRLNRMSGVSRVLFRRLRRYAVRFDDRPLRVLDVASGGGDLAVAWAGWAKASGLRFRVTTVDVSEVAIEETMRRARDHGVEVGGIRRDCLRDGLPLGFDVVTCSLFMHHLEDYQVIKLLQSMRASAEIAALVCDLERSRTNLCLVAAAAHVVSRSPVVHHDAAASVRGAYTRGEFAALAERALAHSVDVRPLFPCRFLASIDVVDVPIAVPAFA